ncbi:CatB-related O-acetyltransferase [Lactobacillus sp. YT155]|uniref:CatB-related O-acetyltransferase n=1 Tax=Lactobacillus sp. YT155 TaxID=3060955 RepID=UPI00265F5559|nr:CatB-related O-acetyltransferase [Lactobacillus sp. YT155]MDO1605368.1 CatB-related O-acetyltransferase [Lactobacillus sp. YT155]
MNEKLYQEIIHSLYRFGQINGNEYSQEMRFWEDGRISGYHNNNEVFWELNDNDELLIFNIDQKLTHVFTLTQTDPQEWKGLFKLYSSEVKHYLVQQPVDFVSTNSRSVTDMPFQKVGKHTYGNIRFLMTAYDEVPDTIEIGNFVSIGPNVSMVARNHDMTQISIYNFMSTTWDDTWKNYGGDPHLDHVYLPKTTIGSDVWIGENVTIIGGVTIGDGAVIGTGSIVTKDVPPYAIAAGNPARIVKYRFSESQIKELLKIKWWNFDDERINQNLMDFNGGISIDEFIEKYKE